MPGPFCPSCSYDLQAQITEWGARCPECGCGFTAEELARMKGWPWRPVVIPLAAIAIPPFLVIALIWIGIDRWYENWPWWHSAVTLAVLVATPVAHQFLAMRWCQRQNWSYMYGAFVGIALTLTSVGAFFVFGLIIFMLGTHYGW